jgi:hypothetical protein
MMKKDIAAHPDVSLSSAAIIAGIGILLIAILALIANFGIFQKLVVPGDANGTAKNIFASVKLFRVGICCFLVVSILDVVVAWSLYVVLMPVNKSLSLLAGWLRLVYAAIFAFAIVDLPNILLLQNGGDLSHVNETSQVNTQVMLLLGSFRNGWDIGLAIFGLHLLIVGYLVFRSSYFPKFLGVLLIIASLGYLVDSFGKLLLPNYNLTIAAFTFIGEALFIFWLLLRGIRGFENKNAKKEKNI